jgi:nucleoside-diphosphate-sugar epimerase
VDLLDPVDCSDKLGMLSNITHILYCARASHTMAAKEPIDENVSMLRNVIDAVESAGRQLEHVHIVQGSKVYGSELGPYKTPARETDPRVPQYNWYYAQEDLLRARAAENWTWSVSRPHGVCEGESAVPRSLATIIAVYAAICKELGRPLNFPGTQAGFQALYQSVDADLLARAIAWISTSASCANQAFNVTNGDYFRWTNVWSKFAEFFEMETGGVRTAYLAEFFEMETGGVRTAYLADEMWDKTHVWDRIVEKHDLIRVPLSERATWSYADFNLARGYDVMSSTLKLRTTGFNECMDTERMFIQHFTRFRAQHAIP